MEEELLIQLGILLAIILVIRYIFRKWKDKKTDAAYVVRINRDEYATLDDVPRNISELKCKKIEGVVSHVNVISKVSGVGIVNTTVEKEVFVKLNDGTEFSNRFNEALLIREGHQVSLKKVFFNDAKFIWAYIYNHSIQEEAYFNVYQIVRNLTKKTYLEKNKFVSLGDYRYDKEYVKDSKEVIEKIRGGC